MKTENQVQKPRGTRELLENVAPNLYRHRDNGSYYGIKKIAGKIKSHALHTADRKPVLAVAIQYHTLDRNLWA